MDNLSSISITERCKRYSTSFIRAVDKHGCAISLIPLTKNVAENDYEELYGQNKVKYGTELNLSAIMNPNPPEQFYKDNHLSTKGDAIIYILSYHLQKIGFLDDDTLEAYQNIQKKLLGYHIRVGSDYYRVDETKIDAVYQGFPLQTILVLTYLSERDMVGE